MPFSKYPLNFLLYLVFSFVSSNTSFAENDTSVIEKNQKHFDAANRFALYSLGLRQLKSSSCANKVNIVDHSEKDITFIHSTFSKEENIYFAEDVIAIKEMEHEEIENYITDSIKMTGNIDNACQKLESLYKTSYKTAKEDFLRLMKAKPAQ